MTDDNYSIGCGIPLKRRLPHAVMLLLILLTAMTAAAAEENRQAPARVALPSMRGEQTDRQLPPPADPETLIRQFDRDKDSRINRAEAPEGLRREWDEIDSDRDGYVTSAELKAQRSRMDAADSGPRQPVGGKRTTSRFQPGGDFSVVTVGTGIPQYNPERSGPSALIQYQGKYFLVDMGNGTQARLNEAALPLREISALILTHQHLDHNEEFIPLFINTRLHGANPEVVGPPQTKKLVEFITDFYAEDFAYRVAHRRAPADDFRSVTLREVKGGESFSLGGMRVSTARVNHSIYTVAYRFEADGRAIVISGDLTYSESLVELARDADLLVIDGGAATMMQGEGVRPGPQAGAAPPPAEGGGKPVKAHAGTAEVAAMAQNARVKRLLLTHLGPRVDEAATIRAIGKTYQGEVIIGRDLLETVAVRRSPETPGSAGQK